MTFRTFCDTLKKLRKNPYGDLIADRIYTISDMVVSNENRVVYLFATENSQDSLTRKEIFSELTKFRYSFPVLVVMENNQIRKIISLFERQEDSDSEIYTLITTKD